MTVSAPRGLDEDLQKRYENAVLAERELEEAWRARPRRQEEEARRELAKLEGAPLETVQAKRREISQMGSDLPERIARARAERLRLRARILHEEAALKEGEVAHLAERRESLQADLEHLKGVIEEVEEALRVPNKELKEMRFQANRVSEYARHLEQDPLRALSSPHVGNEELPV
jgi:chromosome segregation ATPase